MGTYRIVRRPDNRVTSRCTWCGAASPVVTDAAAVMWQRVHRCRDEKEKP